MSEWGRMQDVLHDEFDRQGVKGVDVGALIEVIVNVRAHFPGILGQAEAVAAALDRVERAVSDICSGEDICETHQELLFDGRCEDYERYALAAVLEAIREARS